MTDSSSSPSEKSSSESEEAVDGSYSCFSGDEDRRCFLRKAGVKDGSAFGRRPIEVGLGVCLVVELSRRSLDSSFEVSDLLCSFAGADDGSSNTVTLSLAVDCGCVL